MCVCVCERYIIAATPAVQLMPPLAFVFLPSVLGQMCTVAVRQNRGYANTRE